MLAPGDNEKTDLAVNFWEGKVLARMFVTPLGTLKGENWATTDATVGSRWVIGRCWSMLDTLGIPGKGEDLSERGADLGFVFPFFFLDCVFFVADMAN